ncbi:hypothetical protein V8E54_009658 [Elaphomyces granulatus]
MTTTAPSTTYGVDGVCGRQHGGALCLPESGNVCCGQNGCLTEYGCQFGCVDPTVFQSSMTTAAPTSSHSLSSLTITTATSTHSSSSTASPTSQPSSNLSNGDLAGIVVGSIVAGSIIITCIILCTRWIRRRNKRPGGDETQWRRPSDHELFEHPVV